MSNFHQTRMGQVFFEHTVPQIEHQLRRIADALEEKNKKNTKPTSSRPNNTMKFEDIIQ
jgi:hypothetical protein